MNKLSSRLKYLFYNIDFEYIEIFSGLSGIGWGLVFLLNPTFFYEGPLYSGFRAVIQSHLFWAFVTITGASIQLVAVYINHDRNLSIRKYITLGAVFFWLFVTAEFMLSELSISTALPVYLILALMNGLAYIRLSLRKQRVDKNNVISRK